LCDEATSALDPITTRSILELLERLNKRLGVTIVVITHEMRVVEQICDRVAVMADGKIEEIGAVRDVFLQPKSDTARKLIDPEASAGSDNNTLGIDTIRIAFTGEETGAPVISDMTVKCGLMVNILGANAENIGGKTFGQMLIELPREAGAREKIEAYLKGRNIHYEIKLANSGEGKSPSANESLDDVPANKDKGEA
jgi:D-methionine transport system ATP-binding protein